MISDAVPVGGELAPFFASLHALVRVRELPDRFSTLARIAKFFRDVIHVPAADGVYTLNSGLL
jgi:hypothetical protein